MEALFRIKASEVDRHFLATIRKLFQGKEIVIKITSEWDDTSFLSYSETNEKHILENLAAEPTARFSGDEFQKFIEKSE